MTERNENGLEKKAERAGRQELRWVLGFTSNYVHVCLCIFGHVPGSAVILCMCVCVYIWVCSWCVLEGIFPV